MLADESLRTTRRVPGVAFGCAVLLLTACGVNGLNFIVDTRVEVTAPAQHSEVRLPVTVEWEYRDFDVTGPTEQTSDQAGYFAVFIDGAPQPPGEPLTWHARNDAGCLATPGCPDETWYANRLIFTTTASSFTVEEVLRRGADRPEFHEVTIVLLDGLGRRIGESAFAVEFRVVRE